MPQQNLVGKLNISFFAALMLGSAPLFMLWLFFLVGGLSGFPYMKSDLALVVPSCVYVAMVAANLLVHCFSRQLAPLYTRHGMLTLFAVLSSAGAGGACAVGMGLLEEAWLYPCLIAGAAAGCVLQQSWISLFAVVERRHSIAGNIGSTILTFLLTLLLLGLVTPMLPLLTAFILICANFVSLLAMFRASSSHGLFDTSYNDHKDDEPLPFNNTKTMVSAEIILGLSFGLLLPLTITPDTGSIYLLIIFLSLLIPAIALLHTVFVSPRLSLYRTGWPVLLLMTCSMALLEVPNARSAAVGCMTAAYLYFGIFFNAFCFRRTSDQTAAQRLRSINGGSMIGACGCALGTIAGITLHEYGVFSDSRMTILVVIMVALINVSWAMLLNSRQHERDLGMGPVQVPIPQSLFNDERCSQLAQSNSLTNSEKDILLAISNGLSPGQIAAERQVAVTTVRTQIRSVYAKLGVHSREQLMALVQTANY